jgi:uncharacterized protein involved in exopolysaccharide biosynthesis
MNDEARHLARTSQIDKVRSVAGGQSRSLLIGILDLFFSRWMVICGIFFSACFWSYVALVQAPDTYEATGQVMISRGSIQAVRSEPLLRQQEDVQSEVDILLSISVLNETVRQMLEGSRRGAFMDSAERPLIFGEYESNHPFVDLSLDDLPTTDPARLFEYLKKRVRVQKFGESNVIEISLVSVSPRFAAQAVNTLIDVYEKYQLTVDPSSGQTAFFAAEIDKVDQEIDALHARLAEYKQTRGVVDTERDAELLALRRYRLREELDKLQVDKTALETDLRAVDAGGDQLPAFLRRDETIVKLRGLLFIAKSSLAELRSQLTADHPALQAKLEEVEELQQNLKREEELGVAQQRHLYHQILDKEQELLAKIEGIDALLVRYPTLEAEFDRLDRDIKQRTLKRVDMVEQMFKSTTLGTDESFNKVRVLGYADVPPYPREERKDFKFAVAVLLSLIASFVAAVFVEGLDHSIRRREEIEEQLQVPYLASISSHYR